MHYVDKTQIRMGSLTDSVYLRLRSLIDSGELPPGSPLREVHLAERLDVSRTPVREALRRLESEGLAAFETRAGLAVAVLDRQRIVEIYNFLETLESAAVAVNIGENKKLQRTMLPGVVCLGFGTRFAISSAATWRASPKRESAAEHSIS